MKYLAAIALFIIIFVFGALLLYDRAVKQPFGSGLPTGKADEAVSLTVSRGESAETIARELYDRHLIRSADWFRLYLSVNDLGDKIKTGDYIFRPPLSIADIAKALVAGRQESRRVLIKEGAIVEDIADIFSKENFFDRDDFIKLVGEPRLDYRSLSSSEAKFPKDFSGEFGFLKDKPSYYGLEGYLFPDTYDFFLTATPEQVVTKLLGNFDKKLTPAMRQEIASKNRSIFEIATMASIIEKEVQQLEDMKIVSGIFWARLGRGQALQSDATLSYVLGDTQAAHTLDDLKLDSPYNTYKYAGLPPTPISNPGLNAITAAVYPTVSDYNFFLTASGSGEVIYARTFEEHVRNKGKYLK